MGPLSSLANTTAIIAGKASGELACFCPGQLERESFDNDNAAEVGWERQAETGSRGKHGGCHFSLLIQLRNWTSAGWPGFHLFTCFWKHLFDLWPPPSHASAVCAMEERKVRGASLASGGTCSEDGKYILKCLINFSEHLLIKKLNLKDGSFAECIMVLTFKPLTRRRWPDHYSETSSSQSRFCSISPSQNQWELFFQALLLRSPKLS